MKTQKILLFFLNTSMWSRDPFEAVTSLKCTVIDALSEERAFLDMNGSAGTEMKVSMISK